MQFLTLTHLGDLTMSTLTIPTITDEQRRDAAILIAQFVREGVRFTATSTDVGNDITIKFTGGF